MPISPRLTFPLIVLGVAAAYWLSGLGGLELALVRGQVSPLWPASGVALFCLWQFGPRAIPGIAAGALLVNLSFGPSPLAVLVIVLGNTLAPTVAYLLLRRVGFRSDLHRTTDAVALLGLGGLAGMTVSATLGTGALMLSDAIPAAQFWPTWSVWWAGDAMGVLIVAPVLFALRTGLPSWAGSPVRWLEAFVVLGATLTITLLGVASPVNVLFPAVIPLVWAAVRFQLLGAAPCALVISLIATLAAAENTGPFAGYSLVSTMITLQVFNGSIALIALLLASAISERNQAQEAVEETCTALAAAVTKLSGETGLGERTLAAVRRATNGAAQTGDTHQVEASTREN